jgi:hypothetical protein
VIKEQMAIVIDKDRLITGKTLYDISVCETNCGKGDSMSSATVTKNRIANLNKCISFEFDRLLKTSRPSRLKKHQLVQTILSDDTFLKYSELERRVESFYLMPYHKRTASLFSGLFGLKAYPWLLNDFVLNFRNCIVSDTSLVMLASNISYSIEVNIGAPREISQASFVLAVCYKLSQPIHGSKASGYNLADFVEDWREIAFKKHGNKYDVFFEKLLAFMESSALEIKGDDFPAQSILEGDVLEAIEFRQTDLDWMKGILSAMTVNLNLPKHPLSTGPQNPTTSRLEMLVRTAQKLYPKRNSQLDTVIERVCRVCLSLYKQTQR